MSSIQMPREGNISSFLCQERFRTHINGFIEADVNPLTGLYKYFIWKERLPVYYALLKVLKQSPQFQ